ncbi:TRAM domain-containing protein [Methanobrevibacter sp. OttesenSCG-928-I08]|nr:TRAM domain-containing protein [Methanobrevibacter sp. OttesenSCG-928-I08]
MFENNYKNDSSCPVEVGEEYDVKIEDTGKSGDGIAKVEDFVIFVPGTKVGQEVKVKVNAVRRNFSFGEVVE